jgi:hypothetical protein
MMIYIIDEQINRQIEYGWTEEYFAQYKTIVKTIHREEEFFEDILKNKENIIFLHESFPDKNTKEKIYQRNKEKAISIGVFSGSKNERRKSENRIDLPADVFYKNLTVFLDKVREGDFNIDYLLYGAFPDRERQLLSELEKRNNEEDNLAPIASIYKNLLFLTSEDYIDNPFENAPEVTLYEDEEKRDFSDSRLHTIVREELDGDKYDNIFIPLCFGNSLSDYNGLRLAAHIRCTKAINQLSNIYIYGFVGYKDLLEHPCFNILKTKNVFLIDYNKKAIQEADKNTISSLKEDELTKEIQKLVLAAPKDNHTIANEWAIYRWVTTIGTGVRDEGIDIINRNIQQNLYFKYLQTIYPVVRNELSAVRIEKDDEKSPKILYIDDEAEKGWDEIFATLLCDKSNLDYECLDDIKKLSKEEIIETSINEIKEKDIDIVILDFRLHNTDFSKEIPIEEVTSMEILKQIKEYNKGIQVLIFSATNKIWNLQALERLGADGFIIKEAPENSINPNFTEETIANFKRIMERSIHMTFLKKAYNAVRKIKNEVETISNDNDLEKLKLKSEIEIQLDIAFECLRKAENKENDYSYFNLSYISLYKIIEHINDFYTDEKGLSLRKDGKLIGYYDQENQNFKSIEKNRYPSTKDKILFIYEKSLNGDPKKIVSNIGAICKNRNNIIHPKSTEEFKQTTAQENITLLNTIYTIVKQLKTQN